MEETGTARVPTHKVDPPCRPHSRQNSRDHFYSLPLPHSAEQDLCRSGRQRKQDPVHKVIPRFVRHRPKQNHKRNHNRIYEPLVDILHSCRLPRSSGFCHSLLSRFTGCSGCRQRCHQSKCPPNKACPKFPYAFSAIASSLGQRISRLTGV